MRGITAQRGASGRSPADQPSAPATALLSAAGCRGRPVMASAAVRAPSRRSHGWRSRRGGCGGGAHLAPPPAPATDTSFRVLPRRAAGTAHPCAGRWLVRGSRTSCTRSLVTSWQFLPGDAPTRLTSYTAASPAGCISSSPASSTWNGNCLTWAPGGPWAFTPRNVRSSTPFGCAAAKAATWHGRLRGAGWTGRQRAPPISLNRPGGGSRTSSPLCAKLWRCCCDGTVSRQNRRTGLSRPVQEGPPGPPPGRRAKAAWPPRRPR